MEHPTLLYTFLGRVSSRHGREFERVLAVKVPREGHCQLMTAASEWSSLADPARAIRTTDVWEKHFKDWADKARESAREAAKDGFAPLASAFIAERKSGLQSERAVQNDWLKNRSDQISGGRFRKRRFSRISSKATATDRSRKVRRQNGRRSPTPSSGWRRSEPTAPSRPRNEARPKGFSGSTGSGAQVLDMLFDLRDPEVIPLGVLMLIPEATHAS